MAPAAFKPVHLLFAFIAIPQVLAGPSCARDHYGKDDCVERCKGHWGGGNHYMGGNPWGIVMDSFSGPETDLDSIISTACGMAGTPASDPASTPTDSYPSHPGATSFVPGYTPPSSVSSSDLPSYSSSNSIYPGSDTPSTPATSPTPNPNPSSTPDAVPTSTSGSPSPPSSSPFSSPRSSPSPSPSPSPPPPSSSSSSSSSSIPGNNTPPPTPSPPQNPPPISGNLGGGATPVTLEADALKAHNDVRAQHGAAGLTWSDTLAAAAGAWVHKCTGGGSQGAVGSYGESLFTTTGPLDVTAAVLSWAAGASNYDPNNPAASSFTQVVWKATTQVGCAAYQCAPGTVIADDKGDPAWILACEYDPPGNIEGGFAENVQP